MASLPVKMDLSVPCDLKWLRDTFEDDPDEIREVLQMFLDRAGQLVAAMQANVREADLGGLQRSAHALRGICGTVGAGQMLELLPSSGDVAGLDVDAIARALVEMRAYLENQLGTSFA